MVSNKNYLISSFYAALLWGFCLSFFEMLKMVVGVSANWFSTMDIMSIVGGLFFSYTIIWSVFLVSFAVISVKFLKDKFTEKKEVVLFFWCVAFFSYELLLILVKLNSDGMYISFYGICASVISIIFAALIAYAMFQLVARLIPKGKLDQICLRATSVGICLAVYAMVLTQLRIDSENGNINIVISGLLLVVFLFVSKYLFLIINKFASMFIKPDLKVPGKKILILILVLTISIMTASGISKTKGPKESSRPNILLISLDTLRADHLSCYNGKSKRLSPNLDEIAKSGYLFKKAYSTTSWTLPSHASMVTGLFPSTHKADRSQDQSAKHPVDPLSDSFPTLAEVLGENGYLTAGVISVPYLTSTFGLDRGFQYYYDQLDPFENLPFIYKNEHAILVKLLRFSKILDGNDSDGQKRAGEVNEEALGWLEENKDKPEPFFLFLHYFDPHYIYDPPAPYNIREDGTTIEYFYEIEKLNKGQYSLSSSGTKDLVSLYDGEIRYMDYHLGELFNKLKQWNLMENTLIIITSDHGESFNEHEVWTHGNRLYQEQIHVPMIVHYPKLIPSGQIDSDHIVQLVDLMPTILDISQIPVPDNLQGRSWQPIFQSKPELNYSLAFMELRPDISWKEKNERFGDGIKAVIQNDWKFILSDTGVQELYNIQLDPNEESNLIRNESAKAKDMKSILSAWESSVNQNMVTESGELDSGTLKQLRSLGYLN